MHPILAVADVDAAIDHYRTVLGFFIEWARGRSCYHRQPMARVDARRTDLIDAGANITEAPAGRPWGLYEMRLVDLDKNEFRFASFL